MVKITLRKTKSVNVNIQKLPNRLYIDGVWYLKEETKSVGSDLIRVEECEKELKTILEKSHWELCDCDLGETGYHHCPIDILHPKLKKLIKSLIKKVREEEQLNCFKAESIAIKIKGKILFSEEGLEYLDKVRKEGKCIHGEKCIECLADKERQGLLPR